MRTQHSNGEVAQRWGWGTGLGTLHSNGDGAQGWGWGIEMGIRNRVGRGHRDGDEVQKWG